MSGLWEKRWPHLTSAAEFRFLADLVMTHTSGNHASVILEDRNGGTTRFADNQIIQNVNARRTTFTITVANGLRHGTASATDLTAGSVRDTLRRAEGLAQVVPEDPEYLPPIGPQDYPRWPTFRSETAAAGPGGRREVAGAVIRQCRERSIRGAGIVASSAVAVGVAANTGLFAYEQRTDAAFSVTAQYQEGTGWSAAAHRSIDRLDALERTALAVDKAGRSRDPVELSPGAYTVILEPAAVGGLLSWLIWTLDARAYDRGTSAVAGKLGQPILDARFSLRNAPEHPDLFGRGFTEEGIPIHPTTWIEKGVLRELAYDRFTARQHGRAPMPMLDAPCLTGDESGFENVQHLIRGTERGILVTNLWYIRPVNPADLTLTGMTRDGTWLIEDGRIACAVRNFRFHDSPLRALNRIEAFTLPEEATSAETGKFLVPALKIRDFYFSSVTGF